MSYYFYILVYITITFTITRACNRKPQGATGDPSPVDDTCQILIQENPTTFLPGQQYNISLVCSNGMQFIGFTLAAENEHGTINEGTTGYFDIINNADTRFSAICDNMVESTSTNAKTQVDVAWKAPIHPGNDCVYLKAAILQHRDVWFMDDGFLTKKICGESIDDIDSQPSIMDPCCACDEAKYELTFEGKWSRHTHPKDFPANSWRTRFSDIIGASHTVDYRFWEYGQRATQGLQEFAEHGATKTLEDEIKSNTSTGKVRTIIKAPGITFRRNAKASTLTNVRVDSNHHLVSMVMRIDPSPDWILGVAGLELCLPNCTWIDYKDINLYPWDIGTDAGPSYLSPDTAQIPPDVVRRISSTFPSDYRSPFYNPSGAPMKPLATLHIRKKRIYERNCELANNLPLECAVHPWSEWSECSTKCGEGTQYRERAYKDIRLAENFNCQMELKQYQSCWGNFCGTIAEENIYVPECALTGWSSWSPCSVKCGKGYTIRTRNFEKPYNWEKCKDNIQLDLEQRNECFGEDCGGAVEENFDLKYREGKNFDFSAPSWRTDMTTFSDNSFQERKPYSIDKFITEATPIADDIKWTNIKHPPHYNAKYRENERSEMFTPPPNYSEPTKLQMISNNSFYDRNLYYPQNLYSNFSERNKFKNSADFNDVRFENAATQANSFSNYNVIQEYCFQKPYASMKTCGKIPIVISNYWFYDADDGECKLFTTDNCDENKNKFRTLTACEMTCHAPITNRRISQRV